ncbi:MAG: hypothetical protein GQE15_39705 [Archangiaceae bacterium]|nr:hypothetical protein [Archangiaceae bacterium]
MTDLSFLGRAPSFSFVFFEGAVAAHVPAWLSQCGWAVDDQWPLRCGFDELAEAVRPTKKLAPRKWVVHKAVVPLPGFTALLDPEMVVHVGDHVAVFCRTHATRACSAIWERHSQTILLDETTGAGNVRRSLLVAGVAEGPQLSPWPELVATPTPQTLLGVLASAGVPIAALSGSLDATVLRLLEG